MGKTADMVNVLEFQSTLPEIENPTISVLLGTKAAPPEELKIPAEFVKIAHNSGMPIFSPFKFLTSTLTAKLPTVDWKQKSTESIVR